jgi:nitrous oxidase accessory protein
MDGVEATDNLFSSNRIGMYFDNSPSAIDVSQHFQRNAFVYNDIGLLFSPSVKRNFFSQNSFIDNLEQVGLTGSGDFKDNSFTVAGQGNFWGDYVGYDADGDGLGDLSYVSKSLFENMMDKNPQLRLFQLSPAQQAINLAARHGFYRAGLAAFVAVPQRWDGLQWLCRVWSHCGQLGQLGPAHCAPDGLNHRHG